MDSSLHSTFTSHAENFAIRPKNSPFQQSQQSQQSSSILPDTNRIQVGIDFGTTTSSVCYDIVTKLSPLKDQEFAKTLVSHPQNQKSHRIPSVAFGFTDIASDGSKRMVLKFREGPGRELTGRILAEFQLMKLSLLPAYDQTSGNDIADKMLQSLKAPHQGGLHAIKVHSLSQKLYSQDPLISEFVLCTVNSMENLITLFFGFLWRLTMRHFAITQGKPVEHVMRIFRDSVDIAISAPVLTQDDSILDVYHRLLDDAGYPKSTCVLSEPKSAALFHIAT